MPERIPVNPWVIPRDPGKTSNHMIPTLSSYSMNQSHAHGWSGHVCDQYYYITEYWHSHQTHINCNHINSSGNNYIWNVKPNFMKSEKVYHVSYEEKFSMLSDNKFFSCNLLIRDIDTVVILFHYFWVYFTYLNASHYDILFSFTLFSSLNKCFIFCLVLLYSHCI